MKLKQLGLKFLMLMVFCMPFTACNEDEAKEMDPVVITTSDFTATIDEDPTEGQSLGKVAGTVNEGTVTFSITSQEPADAMTIDENSGELKVKDINAFDFEKRKEVTAVVAVKSGTVSEEAKVTITITDVPVVVTVTDFETTVNENPEAEESLGMIKATASEGSVAFSLTSQEVADALSIDAATGELKVKDATVFDYETRTSLTATVTVTGGSDNKEAKVTIIISNVTEITTTDFFAEVDENPAKGQTIGSVIGTTDSGELTFSISVQNPGGALTIDAGTGELKVDDHSLFDYAARSSISATVTVKSGDVAKEANVTITINEISGNWQAVGKKMFSGTVNSYLDMAFDKNGVPYVAFQNGQFDGRKTTVMKYDGSSWANVGNAGFSAGWASFVSLAFDESVPFITPYVAFTDLVQNNKVTVMKFNEGSWANVGNAGFSPINAEYTKLAINDGTPYVAFSDGANSDKATVMKYDGSSNTWINVGNAGFSSGEATHFSLVFDNNVPYVAFRDVENSAKTTVMKFDGTNWVTVGVPGFSTNGVNSLGLVINNGTPYVAYAGGQFTSKTSVMKYDGANWTLVGSGDFSAEWAQDVSLAFDDDVPYVVFRDGRGNDSPIVMKYQHKKWTIVGSGGISTGSVRYANIEFNNGIPYVGFMESDGSGYEATVMKYTKLIEK